jgi:hypothetical protein
MKEILYWLASYGCNLEHNAVLVIFNNVAVSISLTLNLYLSKNLILVIIRNLNNIIL